MQRTKNKAQWIYLENNVWLFSLKNKTEIKISCSDSTETQNLHGAGQIWIKEKCSIETNENKINSNEYVASAIDITSNWRTIEFNSAEIAPLRLNELSKTVTKFKDELRQYNILNLLGLGIAIAVITLYFGCLLTYMLKWKSTIDQQ